MTILRCNVNISILVLCASMASLGCAKAPDSIPLLPASAVTTDDLLIVGGTSCVGTVGAVCGARMEIRRNGAWSTVDVTHDGSLGGAIAPVSDNDIFMLVFADQPGEVGGLFHYDGTSATAVSGFESATALVGGKSQIWLKMGDDVYYYKGGTFQKMATRPDSTEQLAYVLADGRLGLLGTDLIELDTTGATVRTVSASDVTASSLYAVGNDVVMAGAIPTQLLSDGTAFTSLPALQPAQSVDFAWGTSAATDLHVATSTIGGSFNTVVARDVEALDGGSWKVHGNLDASTCDSRALAATATSFITVCNTSTGTPSAVVHEDPITN